jgi:hypothetical protein
VSQTYLPVAENPVCHVQTNSVRRGADKLLAFALSYFPICSTNKRIFLRWVKEVRKKKYQVCGAQGEYINTFFNPVACFLFKAKDLSAPLLFL